jgi:hypothetical protein
VIAANAFLSFSAVSDREYGLAGFPKFMPGPADPRPASPSPVEYLRAPKIKCKKSSARAKNLMCTCTDPWCREPIDWTYSTPLRVQIV